MQRGGAAGLFGPGPWPTGAQNILLFNLKIIINKQDGGNSV
jgi:hypothetical protein